MATGKLKERDEIVRERWIRVMEARITQEKLQKCYRLQGVNHLENCKDIADKYTQMLKDNRVSGMSRRRRLKRLRISQLQGFKNVDV